jgi:hypothetical protein
MAMLGLATEMVWLRVMGKELFWPNMFLSHGYRSVLSHVVARVIQQAA